MGSLHFGASTTTMCDCRRCTNMESYIISEVPSLAGSDASMQSKATALAGYYFNGQGGPVSAIVQTVAGVNLTDVFAQVNSTRDQAIAVSVNGATSLACMYQATWCGIKPCVNTSTEDSPECAPFRGSPC